MAYIKELELVFIDNSDGSLFENTAQVTGLGASEKWYGVGVIDSLAGDEQIVMGCLLPNPMPVGEPKLLCVGFAYATAGKATISCDWVIIDPNEGAFGSSMIGPSASYYTWGSGDNVQLHQIKIGLGGTWDTYGGKWLHMIVQFNGGSPDWTLAAISTWRFFLLVE